MVMVTHDKVLSTDYHLEKRKVVVVEEEEEEEERRRRGNIINTERQARGVVIGVRRRSPLTAH